MSLPGSRWLIVLMVLWSPVRPGFAADTGLAGFNHLFFRPASGNGLYGLHTSTLLPPWIPAAGLHLHLGRSITEVVAPARGATVPIIATNLTADLHAAIGLTPFLETGIDLPLVLWQEGTNFNSLQTYQTAAFGDARWDLKFRLLPDRRRSLGLALLSGLSLPTGNRGAFAGDRGVTWEGRGIVDKTWRHATVVANLGYRVAPATTVLTTIDDDRLVGGIGVEVPLPLGARSWHAVAEVMGETVVRAVAEISSPVEVRVGVRKIFDSGLVLDVGGGAGLTAAYGLPAYRFLAGLTWNGQRRQEARARQQARRMQHPIDYTLYFALSQARIRPSAHPALRAIGQRLAHHPAQRVVATGYTDRSGSRRFNQMLSQRRARRVCQYLQYFGATSTQCLPRGKGVAPITGTWSPPSRRVDIRE